MKISGIYKIQSISHPDRIYIGSALNLKNRESAHRTGLLRRCHENAKLQNHADKYGVHDLEFEVIESGDFLCKQHRLAREQMWFDRYKYQTTELPFFNIVPIAGSCQGRVLSEETKRKIGEKSRALPKETRKIIADKLRGRKHDPKDVEKVAAKLRGRPSPFKGIPSGRSGYRKGQKGFKMNLSNEERERRRQSAIGLNCWEGKKLSEEHKQHIRDGWARRRALKNENLNTT